MKENEFEMESTLPEFEETREEDELDIYTEEGIENYVDDDSITPSEQGFMTGYLGAQEFIFLEM